MYTNSRCKLSTPALNRTLIAALPDSQATYPGRGTVEQIQIVQQIIERSHEYRPQEYVHIMGTPH